MNLLAPDLIAMESRPLARRDGSLSGRAPCAPTPAARPFTNLEES